MTYVLPCGYFGLGSAPLSNRNLMASALLFLENKYKMLVKFFYLEKRGHNNIKILYDNVYNLEVIFFMISKSFFFWYLLSRKQYKT